jgi:hypothetical protein
MREVEFRAWHKKDRKMYPVVGLAMEDGGEVVLLSVFNKRAYNQIPENLELMQYTGLKDKNGKKIYEGDVITRFLFGELVETAEVYWQQESCSYHLRNPGTHGWGNELGFVRSPGVDCEVIGNIYENPELLKETS